MSSRKIYNTGKNNSARAPFGQAPREVWQPGQPPREAWQPQTTNHQPTAPQKQSLLSKDGELKAQEIEEIINKKLGDISDDSGLEIKELLEAIVNSGLKKNREALEAAIEYVKGDIQKYVNKKQKTNKSNSEHKNNLEEMKMNIIDKMEEYNFPAAAIEIELSSQDASHAAANKTESHPGSFCCGTGGGIKKKQTRKTSKKTKGKKEKRVRKWSKKYKDSINCKKPKGFSQRQHCLAKSKKSKMTKKN